MPCWKLIGGKDPPREKSSTYWARFTRRRQKSTLSTVAALCVNLFVFITAVKAGRQYSGNDVGLYPWLLPAECIKVLNVTRPSLSRKSWILGQMTIWKSVRYMNAIARMLPSNWWNGRLLLIKTTFNTQTHELLVRYSISLLDKVTTVFSTCQYKSRDGVEKWE